MIGTLNDVIYVSGESQSFTDKQTGEIKPYWRGLFTQQGSGAVEFSVDEDVFHILEPLKSYSLDIELKSFNNRLRTKVIGCAEL